MPKVSVIMATFNCKNTVAGSINSILSQTYTDWEFIICDDGSTDGTFEIVKQASAQYPDKITVLRNSVNLKLSYSLNRCLAVVHGAYIARMDGDDEAFPTRLERQVQFLDQHPEYAVVGTAMVPFDRKGDRPTRYAKEFPDQRDLLLRSPFFHATIMMRKNAYDTVGGYCVSKRTERAQDYDMWFRFFAKGLKGYNLQEGLYHVLEDNSAIRRRNLKARAYEVLTRLKGYQMLHYPWYLYPCALKPLVAALVPVELMQRYHIATDGKSK